MQPRALGRKTSDEFVVPLCRTHHRAAHRVADEQAWWKALRAAGIEIAFSREGRVGSRIIRMTSVTTSRQPSTAAAGNGRDT
jgi:hypothetical protein